MRDFLLDAQDRGFRADVRDIPAPRTCKMTFTGDLWTQQPRCCGLVSRVVPVMH